MFLTMLAAWPATVLYMGLLTKLGVDSTAWCCGGALYLAFVVNPSLVIGVLTRFWGFALVFALVMPFAAALVLLVILLVSLGPSGIQYSWHIIW